MVKAMIFTIWAPLQLLKNSPKEEKMFDKNGKQIPVVTMNMILEQPVQHDIYHYLVEE